MADGIDPARPRRCGRCRPVLRDRRAVRVIPPSVRSKTFTPRSDLVPTGIVDPLTSRELEVLEMLAAGRSNQAIAGELVVTLDTVKKHVGHVLGKLGAANRTEAVARARELSLIL